MVCHPYPFGLKPVTEFLNLHANTFIVSFSFVIEPIETLLFWCLCSASLNQLLPALHSLDLLH